MAILKRWHFDRRSEQMDPMQRSLLDESIDADIEAISLELEALKEKPASPPKEQPRRVALPASSRAGKYVTSLKKPNAAAAAVSSASARM